jgi:predicted RNase H-like HicB family nuclease
MIPLQKTITAVIVQGEDQYVAECMNIPVVTQGQTLDEVVANLKEAVDLHLEDEDMQALGLVESPALVITMEVASAYAA